MVGPLAIGSSFDNGFEYLVGVVNKTEHEFLGNLTLLFGLEPNFKLHFTICSF